MTDEQLEALGQRWIAAGGDVRPGMMICDFEGALRVIATAAPGRLYVAGRMALDTWTVEETDWIDLSDGATKGAALEVVRERWGIRRLWVEFQVDNAMWSVGDWVLGWACLDGEKPPPDIMGDSEEEVLVLALESAPPPP